MKFSRYPFRGPNHSSSPGIRTAAQRLKFAAVVRLAAFLIVAPILPNAAFATSSGEAASTPALTFTFDNARITREASAVFYEFDVLAAASGSSLLGNTQLYLNYPTPAFGSDLGANGTITVARGALIANDLIYDVGFADNLSEGPGKISIFSEFKPIEQPEHGIALGTDPAVLFQIRIQIADTTAPIRISFDTDCAAGPCMVGEQFLSDGQAFASIEASDTLEYVPPVVNAAPEAADDVAVTRQDTPIDIQVLLNDVDANGDSLQIVAVGQPEHGGATKSSPGIITYTPPAGFIGSDAFTYTVSDGNGGLDTANVTVVVLKPNAPPAFASGQIFIQPEDGAEITIGGTTAPVNPSETLPIVWTAATDPEGGSITYTWELSDTPGFDRILISESAGTSTSLEVPISRIVTALDAAGLAIFSSGVFYHRVIAFDEIDEVASDAASVTLVRGIVTAADAESLPNRFELAQNYPNPFNPSTTVAFTLPHAADVTLRVFNALGAEVGSYVDRRLTAGTHQVKIDAGDLPSGVYLYRLEAGEFSAVRKMILLK